LKKVDKEAAMKAYAKSAPSTSTSTPASNATSAPAAAATSRAPALFAALKDRLTKNPSLAKEVAALLEFKVDGKSWLVDMTGSGAVREGSDAKAQARFTIEGEDLAALAKNPASARELFQRGKLRVDGDVRLAHKLGFLKDLAG
jgi:3-hydroxyacyl-CoA dehydrogenase/3a,7a,12a-trihydroxy-5b-cholest-24-enoyl-CoA hydratase